MLFVECVEVTLMLMLAATEPLVQLPFRRALAWVGEQL